MARILYFTDDFSPENQAYAKQHGLIIRNAKAYDEVDFLEQCDMVCGQVPKPYLDKFAVFELPEQSGDAGDELAKLTVPRLKELATQKGLVFDDNIKKADLVSLIVAAKEQGE